MVFEMYDKDIIIGRVLSFKYINGSTEKEKQYSLDTAPTSTTSLNRRGIEVLALWYIFDKNLVFQPLHKPSFFVNKDNYVASIYPPQIIRNSATEEKSYKINGNTAEILESLSKLLS